MQKNSHLSMNTQDTPLSQKNDSNQLQPEKIERFVGPFAFLSNFFPSTFYMDGKKYPDVEHAYQACKSLSEDDHELIRNAASAGMAKQLGRKVKLRDDWESVKLDLMRKLITLKFENPLLRELLLMTDDAELIEGNNWNDTFYGICRGKGQNWLGKLLMEERKRIHDERTSEL